MSEDDLLQSSLRALRETTSGQSEHAASTRADILARLRLRQKRKRRLATIALPLAAAFVITTAWAAVTGRLPGLETEPAPAPSSTLKHGTGSSTSVTPAASASPNAGGSTPTDALTFEPAPSSAPSAAPTPIASNASPQVRHGGGRAVSAREQALYTKAHEAHFIARDPESALRGWNEYLAAYPNGEFAPEATYNRAISLVRTGRKPEAMQALAPFAKGAYGGYRQAEAANLLDALRADDAGP